MKMDCGIFKEELYLFIDGELSGDESASLNEHSRSCPGCAALLENEKKADLLIRDGISRTEAPSELRERVFGMLGEPAGLNIIPRLRLLPKPVTVSVMAVLLMVIFSFPLIFRQSPITPLFAESVSSHVKFTGGEMPPGIISGNPSEIKDWFHGKLDFEVFVPDLSRGGYGLSGAGVCRINGRETAWLVYEKESSYISVFLIDVNGLKLSGERITSTADNVFYAESIGEYQCVLCACAEKGCGIARLYVSDLSERELMRTVELKCGHCEHREDDAH